MIVVVAVVTFKRVNSLARLLASCDKLAKPDDCRLIFLIVDNDRRESAGAVAWCPSAFDELHYVCETKRGIPCALNRALDEAHLLGGHVLCFVDDDESPTENWLRNIVSCWRHSNAQLVGGPVDVAPLPRDADLPLRLINASLVGRMARKSRKTAQAAKAGRPYTILTNNWLCDLHWQQRSGIRFDEKFLV